MEINQKINKSKIKDILNKNKFDDIDLLKDVDSSKIIIRCKHEDSAGECTAFILDICEHKKQVCNYMFRKLYANDIPYNEFCRMWGKLWNLEGWGK